MCYIECMKKLLNAIQTNEGAAAWAFVIAIFILPTLIVCLMVSRSGNTSFQYNHSYDDLRMNSETHMVDNQMVHAEGIGDVRVLSVWPDFYTHAIFSGDRVFILRPRQDDGNDVFRGTLLSTAGGWNVILESKAIDLGTTAA